jgi:hypothetical protein
MATWNDPGNVTGAAVGGGQITASHITANTFTRESFAVNWEHLPAIRDALLGVLSDTAMYAALRARYQEALDALPLPEKGIAKYGESGHTEPPEVRHVSSSDSAASGDEIS